MKYDDAAWHHGGDFPADLPSSARSTHIGMFLYWLISRAHIDDELLDDAGDEIAHVRRGDITAAAFLMSTLDGKLIDDDLDDEGNSFALAYYEPHEERSAFMCDYTELFGVDVNGIYRVADTVENQKMIAAVIDRRYASWVERGRPKTVLVSKHRDWRIGETRRGG